jgi:hypothetical protein
MTSQDRIQQDNVDRERDESLQMTERLGVALRGQVQTLRFLAERAPSEHACRPTKSSDLNALSAYCGAFDRANALLSEADPMTGNGDSLPELC